MNEQLHGEAHCHFSCLAYHWNTVSHHNCKKTTNICEKMY